MKVVKSELIQFRVTPKQKEALEKKAEENDVSIATYCRTKSLKGIERSELK